MSNALAHPAACQTPCAACSHMATFYDREYTDFEKANFVTAFQCPKSWGVLHEQRHCDLCQPVKVPPRTKEWNRISSDSE
jgi:hypothetical protein